MFTTSEHTLHGLRRREVSHVYGQANVRTPTNAGDLCSVTMSLIKEISRASAKTADGSVEMKSMFHYFACDVMSRFVFGPETHLNLVGDPAQRPLVQDRISASHFRKLLVHGWYPGLMRAISKSTILPATITSLASRNSQILQIGTSAAKEAQQAAANGDEKHGTRSVTSVVDKLAIRMLDPDNKARLSTNYIASEAMDHIMAALFRHMSLPENRHRQEALQKELDSTFGDCEGLEQDAALGYRKLDACPQVLAVIKETLRLNPPIPDSLERVNTSVDNLSIMGYTIPKGTVISSQPYSIHRDATVFPRPEEWIPERWLEQIKDDEEGTRAKNRQFWAFGSGSRMCLGMHLAWMEMKVVVAAMYLTYETQLGSRWEEADADIRLFPRGPDCPIIFRVRQRS
ncbi:cytochrome P450 [Plectosphaerella plurivora]|uniref:Cytochrome P450 n=1 Tax=Plectosphaerella plurivora TaxID=936078 RepID=A0A9P8VDX5_9PEZI|nr:cytochrome P450 [Plectosphaerella plurivora]